MNVATFVSTIFDNKLPFRVEAYDGSVAEPTVTSTANSVTVKILTRDAISRVLTHPGELGLARAYVAGDIDVDGDLDPLFELSVPPLRQLLNANHVRSLLSVVGSSALRPAHASVGRSAPSGRHTFKESRPPSRDPPL